MAFRPAHGSKAFGGGCEPLDIPAVPVQPLRAAIGGRSVAVAGGVLCTARGH